MTPEQIIEMAKQAKVSIRGHYAETGSTPAELQAFAQLVRNETLEEAAEKLDTWGNASSVTYIGSGVKVAADRLRKFKS